MRSVRLVPWFATLLLLTPGLASAQASGLERTVDTTVAPGDDFYAYANGAWLHATTIPAGRARWGAREEIAATTQAQITAIFDAARTAPKGSLARKVFDVRAAYLDQGTIDAKGVAPLRPLFHAIDLIGDRAALTRALGRGMRADVDPLNWAIYRGANVLGLSVEPGINGERTYVPFLVQGGLGLGDRDEYLSTDTAKVAKRAKYRAYVEHLLALAGFDRAAERADRVIALEHALAESQASIDASAQDHNADSLWSRADFARRAPGLDWSLFFTAAGLSRQMTFVPWQPSAITGVAALVASEPLEAWKDYLRFHAIHDHLEFLPRSFGEEGMALQGMPATASVVDSFRAHRALDVVQAQIGEGLGRLYAERYFPAAQKARVQEVVANVKVAFQKRLEAATWMGPETKRMAITQIQRLYIGVGYPERWQDYGDLTVDPKDALGNALRAEARTYHQAVARLGRPVDRTDWWMLPEQAGALLIFQQDAYDFSAALLQPPKYDARASDAATYGAIGAVIGHDVSHYVDVLGAEYDSLGRERRWYTPADYARFDTLAAPIVDQYNGYHPFADLAVDGRKSRTENVADLAGLSAAFDAYRASLGARGTDRAYVRQQDREFFIAFGQSWRSRLSDPVLRAAAVSDHAPDRYRVATVRNLDAWYEAFDVRPGQALYLAPSARVKVW